MQSLRARVVTLHTAGMISSGPRAYLESLGLGVQGFGFRGLGLRVHLESLVAHNVLLEPHFFGNSGKVDSNYGQLASR